MGLVAVCVGSHVRGKWGGLGESVGRCDPGVCWMGGGICCGSGCYGICRVFSKVTRQGKCSREWRWETGGGIGHGIDREHGKEPPPAFAGGPPRPRGPRLFLSSPSIE